MKNFIKEWWYGDINDIVLLRIPFDKISNPKQSTIKYYADQEIWTYEKIKPEFIQINTGNLQGPYNWISLCEYYGEDE